MYILNSGSGFPFEKDGLSLWWIKSINRPTLTRTGRWCVIKDGIPGSNYLEVLLQVQQERIRDKSWSFWEEERVRIVIAISLTSNKMANNLPIFFLRDEKINSIFKKIMDGRTKRCLKWILNKLVIIRRERDVKILQSTQVL